MSSDFTHLPSPMTARVELLIYWRVYNYNILYVLIWFIKSVNYR